MGLYIHPSHVSPQNPKVEKTLMHHKKNASFCQDKLEAHQSITPLLFTLGWLVFILNVNCTGLQMNYTPEHTFLSGFWVLGVY